MTKVDKLETLDKKNKKGENPINSSTTPGASNSCINPERMKKAGATKTIDGKLQYWCTQHVCTKGRYNGLYCNHDDSGHPEWQRRKDEFKANKKKGNTSGNTPKTGAQNSTNGRSFRLTDKLKTALCTQGQMSAEQVEEILGTDFS